MDQQAVKETCQSISDLAELLEPVYKVNVV